MERMRSEEPLPRHEELHKEENFLSIYSGFMREKTNLSRIFYPEHKLNKEITSEISKTHNSFLESYQLSIGVDRFILESIQDRPRIIPEFRPLVDFPSQPDTFQPPLARIPHGRTFRSRTGLTVGLGTTTTYGVTVEGEQVAGQMVARIDFTPGGRTRFEPKQITDSLANGIQGIRELVEAIDTGQIDEVQTLVGTTNINMALIAQRLGFRIVDQDRTADGEIDATKSYFTVVAEMENVRSKVREFEEQGRLDRIQRRHQRQTTKQ